MQRVMHVVVSDEAMQALDQVSLTHVRSVTDHAGRTSRAFFTQAEGHVVIAAEAGADLREACQIGLVYDMAARQLCLIGLISSPRLVVGEVK